MFPQDEWNVKKTPVLSNLREKKMVNVSPLPPPFFTLGTFKVWSIFGLFLFLSLSHISSSHVSNLLLLFERKGWERNSSFVEKKKKNSWELRNWSWSDKERVVTAFDQNPTKPSLLSPCSKNIESFWPNNIQFLLFFSIFVPKEHQRVELNA